MKNTADIFRDCALSVRDNLDQTLIRLSNCENAGSAMSMPTTDLQEGILYELPQTGLRVNAPLDATKTDPGTPVTVQPAPEQVPVIKTVKDGEDNKIVSFAKKNPAVVAGVALVGLYLLSRKRR